MLFINLAHFLRDICVWVARGVLGERPSEQRKVRTLLARILSLSLNK